MNYRPDINGLRAISVLLVLLFHAGVPFIQSGFIGVDIFFVISGFLITTGIQNGLKKGNFSFVTFFKHRLWRLQPVFLCLILVVVLITSLTYLPIDYLHFTKSLKWASRFQANVYFSNLNTGYFSDDKSIIPLLHTWSLSIEWCWYLILPFIMFIMYRVARVRKLVYWIIPFTLIMIIITLFFSHDDSLKHYYSFTGRVFEMSLGSCLAAVPVKSFPRFDQIIKSLLGLICLVVIIYVGTLDHVSEAYPNGYALAVCLAAVILLYIGADGSNNLVSWLLSLKPMVFIGMISYSLYIWHWPILAFQKYLFLHVDLWKSVAAVALSIIPAYFSWRFIEEPFRKKHYIGFRRTILILFIVPYVLVSVLDTQNKKHDGYPHRFGKSYEKITEIEKIYNYNDRTDNKNICPISVKEGELFCRILASNSGRSMLILGDSYGDHSWMFMKAFAEDANISLLSSTTGGCMPLPTVLQPDYGPRDNACRKMVNQRFAEIDQKKYHYVVLSSVWARYIEYTLPNLVLNPTEERSREVSRQTMTIALDDALSRITQVGSIPVIVSSSYDTANENYPSKINRNQCVVRKIKLHSLKSAICDFPNNYPNDENRLWWNNLVQRMKQKYPTLITLDMSDVQCTSKKCRADIEGYPIYRDLSGHITEYASHIFGQEYIRRFGNPFR